METLPQIARELSDDVWIVANFREDQVGAGFESGMVSINHHGLALPEVPARAAFETMCNFVTERAG